MKKFLKLILCFILIVGVSSVSFAKKKSKKRSAKRSASSASGLVAVKEKSKSSSSDSSSKKTKKSSKKSKSSKNSDKKSGDKNSEEKDDDKSSEKKKDVEVSATEQCMIDNVETLLDNECKFLNDKDILSKLTNFYCIYNVKDRTKVESVYNYNLYQNYGIRDLSLKDGDVSVTVKNPSSGSLKGAAKYYDFLLKGLEDKTLNDGRILDFITEEIIDANDALFAGQAATVQSVSVSNTTISMDYSKDDIENCKKATKKVIQTCGITGNTEMQEKIDTSCGEYNSALMKNAAEKKGKVLDAKAELAKVLLNRAGAVIDAKNYKVDLDEKSVDLQKKENEVNAKKEALETSATESK